MKRHHEGGSALEHFLQQAPCLPATKRIRKGKLSVAEDIIILTDDNPVVVPSEPDVIDVTEASTPDSSPEEV